MKKLFSIITYKPLSWSNFMPVAADAYNDINTWEMCTVYLCLIFNISWWCHCLKHFMISWCKWYYIPLWWTIRVLYSVFAKILDIIWFLNWRVENTNTKIISMAQYRRSTTPSILHWSYVSLYWAISTMYTSDIKNINLFASSLQKCVPAFMYLITHWKFMVEYWRNIHHSSKHNVWILLAKMDSYLYCMNHISKWK